MELNIINGFNVCVCVVVFFLFQTGFYIKLMAILHASWFYKHEHRTNIVNKYTIEKEPKSIIHCDFF